MSMARSGNLPLPRHDIMYHQTGSLLPPDGGNPPTGSSKSYSTSPMQPTWFGHLLTAKDALIILEACLQGKLQHCPRRPHDRERPNLIKSGAVFIYEENASGIKRWTDGLNWSPSRIMGNYLVYRELKEPFAPGEKKRASKKKTSSSGDDRTLNGGIDSSGSHNASQYIDEDERRLFGSLIDSYPFKEDGLMKKTITLKYRNIIHHVVSYYDPRDLRGDKTLFRPLNHPDFQGITVRPELEHCQKFKVPIPENDDYPALSYAMIPQQPMTSIYGMPMNSLPALNDGYSQTQQTYQVQQQSEQAQSPFQLSAPQTFHTQQLAVRTSGHGNIQTGYDIDQRGSPESTITRNNSSTQLVHSLSHQTSQNFDSFQPSYQYAIPYQSQLQDESLPDRQRAQSLPQHHTSNQQYPIYQELPSYQPTRSASFAHISQSETPQYHVTHHNNPYTPSNLTLATHMTTEVAGEGSDWHNPSPAVSTHLTPIQQHGGQTIQHQGHDWSQYQINPSTTSLNNQNYMQF